MIGRNVITISNSGSTPIMNIFVKGPDFETEIKSISPGSKRKIRFRPPASEGTLTFSGIQNGNEINREIGSVIDSQLSGQWKLNISDNGKME